MGRQGGELGVQTKVGQIYGPGVTVVTGLNGITDIQCLFIDERLFTTLITRTARYIYSVETTIKEDIIRMVIYC